MADSAGAPPAGYSLAAVRAALDAADGRDRVARMIAAGMGPATHFGYDGTPLSLAVARRKNDIVALLLDHGADPNRTAGAFDTAPLFDAAVDTDAYGNREDDVSTLDLLLQRGAKLPGSWALQGAAAHLSPTKVRFLLAKGADVNEVLSDNEPIFEMYRNGDPDAMPTGETALLVAVRAVLLHRDQYQELKDSAQHVETVRALLEGGANRDHRDSTGASAVEVAQAQGLANVAQLISTWRAS